MVAAGMGAEAGFDTDESLFTPPDICTKVPGFIPAVRVSKDEK